MSCGKDFYILNMEKKSKKKEITIRSSTSEYLTFVAATGDSQSSVEMRYEDENIWLTQKLMATLYDISVAAVNQHLKRYLTLASECERQLLRNT
jgi:hypothetical protein